MTRIFAIVCLLMCGACSAVQSKATIKEPCMASVVTYGDAVECMIKLNEILNN